MRCRKESNARDRDHHRARLHEGCFDRGVLTGRVGVELSDAREGALRARRVVGVGRKRVGVPVARGVLTARRGDAVFGVRDDGLLASLVVLLISLMVGENKTSSTSSSSHSSSLLMSGWRCNVGPSGGVCGIARRLKKLPGRWRSSESIGDEYVAHGGEMTWVERGMSEVEAFQANSEQSDGWQTLWHVAAELFGPQPGGPLRFRSAIAVHGA